MRISIPSLKNSPWYLKPFFWRQKKKYGQVLTPGLVWAKMPKLFVGVAFLYGILDRKSSPLTPVLRSLITVRISQINWCAFCVDINSAVLMQRTGSDEKLNSLSTWRESDVFSNVEKAVLNYTEKITYSEQQVDDECVNRVKEHFDEKSLVELTALIAFQNFSSKFNSALAIAPQGFCKIDLPK